MAAYRSADAEKILGVKNHVLRFWVDEIPLIQPRKDLGGHRIFSGRDIRLLLRLKYLLYGKNLSLEAAKRTLEAELSCDWPEMRAELDAIRSKLVDLFFTVHHPENGNEP